MRMFKNQKFELGQIVQTQGSANRLDVISVHKSLERHAQGDWGDICAEDKKINDRAIAYEGNEDKQDRVLSSYKDANGVKFWIITEWDRSYTTVLLPDEY